jgi:hypothetical protein
MTGLALDVRMVADADCASARSPEKQNAALETSAASTNTHLPRNRGCIWQNI